jgi:sugar O-acyltransferase (sialic acid O-acetyltransferase NeuD family)
MILRFLIFGSGDGSKKIADLIHSIYEKNFVINFIKKKQKSNYSNRLSLIGMGTPTIREKVFKILQKKKIRLFTLIHKSVYISKSAKIGSGTIIHQNSYIGHGARIGKNCLINENVSISHDVTIGNHSVISPGTAIGGGTKVGKIFFSGLNATLIPYIKVGNGCSVSACSTLNKSIKANNKFIKERVIKSKI